MMHPKTSPQADKVVETIVAKSESFQKLFSDTVIKFVYQQVEGCLRNGISDQSVILSEVEQDVHDLMEDAAEREEYIANIGESIRSHIWTLKREVYNNILYSDKLPEHVRKACNNWAKRV